MITTIINLLTFGILFSSIISITSNNPIISIIFLITAFVNAAGYLILLGINFIGISYIVIYVGAIAVLFLFIILMINIKLTDILDTGYNFTKNLPLGLNIASLLLLIFFSVATQLNFYPFAPQDHDSDGMQKQNIVPSLELASFSPSWLGETTNSLYCLAKQPSGCSYSWPLRGSGSFGAEGAEILDTKLLEFSQIEVLGHYLYTYASIFLIILSLILLLAMLAIIIISKKNIKNI